MSEHDNPIAPSIPDHDLLARIGEGAYGDVWLARNIMGDFRAVKVVRRDRFESSRPFDREFEGIKKFEPVSRTHESQLDVLHIGRNGGYFYYVMEVADDVLRGRNIDPEHYAPHTLRSDILERGRLPFDECLQIALSLTTALAHLHSNGLVHRDIKPSNVIFVNGQPKLADIGLVTDSDATMTMVGTEGYLPPEGPGKPSADLYSLGKVLYEISTGLDRTEFPELPTGQHLHEDRERFAELNELITKACSTDPGRRYETAAEMREDLLQIQAGGSLIRSRLLEKRIQWLKRAAAVTVVLLALAGSGYLYQKKQTERAEQLTQQLTEKTEELEQKTTEAESSAKAAIAANYHLHNQNAIRFMKEGNLQEAALWSHSALQLAEPDSEEAWSQEFRIESLVAQMPEVLDHIDGSAYRQNLELLASVDHEMPNYLVTQGSEFVLVDSATGAHVGTLPTSDFAIGFLMSDGKILEADLDAHVFQTRDIESGEIIAKFNMPANLFAVDLIADGERLIAGSGAGSDDGKKASTACFDTRTGELKWQVDFEDAVVTGDEARSGDHVAVVLSEQESDVGATRILLLDGNDGLELDNLERDGVSSVDFSLDGRMLLFVVDAEGIYRRLFACPIIDGRFGESWQIDEALADDVFRISGSLLSFVPLTRHEQVDQDTIFLTRTSKIIQYNWKTRSVTKTLPELPQGALSAWAFSPDQSFIVAASQQDEIWLYDLDSESGWQRVLKCPVAPIALDFTSEPGRLVITGADQSVRLLRLPIVSPAEHHELAGIEVDGSNPIQWDSRNRHRPIMVGRPAEQASQPGFSALQLDLQSLETEPLLPRTNEITSIAINNQSNLVAVGTRTTGFEIWNLDDRTLAFADDRFTNHVYQLRWDKSGSNLAGTTRNGEVFALHYGATPEYIFSYDFKSIAPNDPDQVGIDALEWDPTGEFLFASRESVHLLWNMEEQRAASILTNRNAARAAKFSPDGEHLALCFTGGILIYNRENEFSQDHPTSLRGPTQYLPTLAWSPDSESLVTVQLSIFGEGRAHLWNLGSRPDGHDETTMRSTNVWRLVNFNPQLDDRELHHDTQVSVAAFDDSGRLLATGDQAGKVNVWNAQSGELLVSIENTGGGVAAISFSPDSRYLLCVMENRFLRIHDLEPKIRDSQTLTSRLRLLCGGTFDNQGVFKPANTDQLLSDLNQVKNSPGYTGDAMSSDLVDWHASKVGETKVFQGDVSKALYHVNQLIELQPEETKWAELKKRLEAVPIPPRDPNLPPRLIDLSDYYNANLHEVSEGTGTGGVRQEGHNFGELTAGVYHFEGMDFDIRGLVMLSGLEEREAIQKFFKYPASVDGIKVEQKARAVHFVHASKFTAPPDEVQIGEYEMHYEDGTSVKFPIIYNRNITDWWDIPTIPGNPKELPEATFVWTGESVATRRGPFPAKLRISKAIWTNPHPNKLITHVDFKSAQKTQAPFLLAMTVEP